MPHTYSRWSYDQNIFSWSLSFWRLEKLLSSTFTVPFSNTWFFHKSIQLSGEWQNISEPPRSGKPNPFWREPMWGPKIVDQGRGSKRPARRRASWNCFSSLKRWKKEEACVNETCPRSGLSEARDWKSVRSRVGLLSLGRARMLGLDISPGINLAGNDSWVSRSEQFVF
jgi:hypothetical protein